MIKDYKVITADSLPACAALVREYISAGWQPIGGIAIDSHSEGLGLITQTFCQAIVKS